MGKKYTLEQLLSFKSGILSVVRKEPTQRNKRGKTVTMIRVLCGCGREYVASIACVTGHSPSKSCGCLSEKLKTEKRKERYGKRSFPVAGSPEYRCWSAIKKRCYYVNGDDYRLYGARGITVCDRWLESFENFYLDMGARPSKLHSIDRIDNNQGYSPDNCRWSDKKDQARNTRRNVLVEYNGRLICIQELSDICGVRYATLRWRILSGWPMEKALNTKKK
jgi:hypothetical protein